MTSQKNAVRVTFRTPKENGNTKRTRREYAKKLKRITPTNNDTILAFTSGFYMG